MGEWFYFISKFLMHFCELAKFRENWLKRDTGDFRLT